MKKKETVKPFYKSVVIWFNALSFLAILLDFLTQGSVIIFFIKDKEISNGVVTLLVALLALINIILRRRTKDPISFKLR